MRTGFLFAAMLALLAVFPDEPKNLSPEERKQLKVQLEELASRGIKYSRTGQPETAVRDLTQALEIARKLYSKLEFPDGHVELAANLFILGSLQMSLGKLDVAERLLEEAVDSIRLLHKDDHLDVALYLDNFGSLRFRQGKLRDAAKYHRESLEMRRRLLKGDHPSLFANLLNLGVVYAADRNFADAESSLREALEMGQRLTKDDHPSLAMCAMALGDVLLKQGKLRDAEPHLREAFEMRKRLFSRTHPETLQALALLGEVLRERGKLEAAERAFRDLFEGRKRLFDGDHQTVADTLDDLATVVLLRRDFPEAEKLYRELLQMQKRLHAGDHIDTSYTLQRLANVLHNQRKLAEAETLFRDSLKMERRIRMGDHSEIVQLLNNLSGVLHSQDKLDEAERIANEAIEMARRLGGDRGKQFAVQLTNLAYLQLMRGKQEEADRLFRESVRVFRAGVETAAVMMSEGIALNILESFPHTMNGCLSTAQARKTDPMMIYPEIWGYKGLVSRIVEHRHRLARAVPGSATAAILRELSELRGLRAELVLTPRSLNENDTKQHHAEIDITERRIEQLNRDLRSLVPSIKRTDQLAQGRPADLQKELAADTVFVDFLGYTFFEHDRAKPGKQGRETPSYLAFVVTRDAVKWVDLGEAAPIEKAVGLWRESITTAPYQIPADVPAKVRELVWAKVRKEFPAGTKVVYISPDLTLTRVPWSALPGDEPGKIVLEEFAVAVVPHGLFLLDQLRPQEPTRKPTDGLLAVGGVPYDTSPPATGLFAQLPAVNRARGQLPIKVGDKLQWAELKFTKGEAEMAARIAVRKKITAELVTGADASTDRVLSDLPKAKFAHFATHGFFADASFRSVLQLDPKLFEITARGERVGAGAQNPMTMSGLVFAGANKPETRGRGLITGDHLIDRDLSGLELAVLSACETGLGDVAGGEGVFGLQRAFHVAGCRNVVASLWKVDDAATAALMNEFYTQLWTHDQPPILALQKAQLAIYRADPKDFAKLASRGIEEGTLDLSNIPIKNYPANPKGGNHPALWAAFSLSGVGR